MNCRKIADMTRVNWLEFRRRIYDTEYLCPTISCAQGGNTETKIAVPLEVSE